MFWRRNNRVRNRRKDAARGLLRLPAISWRRFLPAGLTLLAVLAVVFGVRFALDQPVERVDISGRFQRVQAVDVQKAVRTALGQHGMVGVDLQAVSLAVQQIPWVDRASVARSWPRSLAVQVIEQTPVARWGESGLLNTRGEVFVRDSRHIPAELPELAGPPGSEANMTERYLAAQPRLIEAGLRLSRLQLDERGSWEVELDNGVHLRLGHTQVDERFDRFIVAAARIVAAQAAEIKYVDMRYANGFAVGWRVKADEVKRG
ncbi:MAG: cell division protein FtsQ/DivIB [Steroidobacteraceae bacterium]